MATTRPLSKVSVGLIPAAIAKSKGRDFLLWWLFGAALLIVALPHPYHAPRPRAARATPRRRGRASEMSALRRVGEGRGDDLSLLPTGAAGTCPGECSPAERASIGRAIDPPGGGLLLEVHEGMTLHCYPWCDPADAGGHHDPRGHRVLRVVPAAPQ